MNTNKCNCGNILKREVELDTRICKSCDNKWSNKKMINTQMAKILELMYKLTAEIETLKDLMGDK